MQHPVLNRTETRFPSPSKKEKKKRHGAFLRRNPEPDEPNDDDDSNHLFAFQRRSLARRNLKRNKTRLFQTRLHTMCHVESSGIDRTASQQLCGCRFADGRCGSVAMVMVRISSFPLSGRAPVTPTSSQVVLRVHRMGHLVRRQSWRVRSIMGHSLSRLQG